MTEIYEGLRKKYPEYEVTHKVRKYISNGVAQFDRTYQVYLTGNNVKYTLYDGAYRGEERMSRIIAGVSSVVKKAFVIEDDYSILLNKDPCERNDIYMVEGLT